MTLLEWHRDVVGQDIFERTVCMTIGTDGLKPSRDHLMSIGYSTDLDEQKADIHLVEGADPTKVVEYTGLTPELYDQGKLGLPRVAELIVEAVPDNSFLALYSPDFFYSFIPVELNMLSRLPYLDVPQYIRFKDSGFSIPHFIKDVRALQDYVLFELKNSSLKKGEYAIDKLYSRFFPDAVLEGIVLEQKLVKLMRVFSLAVQL